MRRNVTRSPVVFAGCLLASSAFGNTSLVEQLPLGESSPLKSRKGWTNVETVYSRPRVRAGNVQNIADSLK